MPSRNVVKIYTSETYYHLYNRGVEKRPIFLDADDYSVFLNLLKRYLSGDIYTDKYGREAKNYKDRLELLAYCLMKNHFHLLVFQHDENAIAEFMQSLTVSYVGYFNDKYDRIGKLFQGAYKASNIDTDAYLWHISRYIHLNPARVERLAAVYPYSSYPYYLGERQADWVRPQRILGLIGAYNQSYLEFMKDGEDYRKTLGEVANQLA